MRIIGSEYNYLEKTETDSGHIHAYDYDNYQIKAVRDGDGIVIKTVHFQCDPFAAPGLKIAR